MSCCAAGIVRLALQCSITITYLALRPQHIQDQNFEKHVPEAVFALMLGTSM